MTFHTYIIQGLHHPDLTIQQSSMVYLSSVIIQRGDFCSLASIPMQGEKERPLVEAHKGLKN